MYVTEVIPLAVLPPNAPQIVSYLVDHELPRGAVVRVPFSGREFIAIVLGTATIESQKLTLKKSLFSLKKVSAVLADEPRVSRAQLRYAAWLAKRYAASLSMCMKIVLPPSFTGVRSLARGSAPAEPEPPQSAPTARLPIIVHGRTKDTLTAITEAVSANVRRGRQTLIIVPEVSAVTPIAAHLAEYRPLRYSTDVSRTEQTAAWKRAQEAGSIIVGTRAALFLPFTNLGAIVVEDHQNDAYKSDMSPKYVAPDVAAYLAEQHGATLTLTTPILGVSDAHAVRVGSATERGSAEELDFEVVDMAREVGSGSSFLFSRTLEDQLCAAASAGSPILLYSARKAYSGILTCRACRGLARCATCDVPLRVHRITASAALSPRESMLVCYHCGAYHPFPDRCGNCASTALTPSGTPGSQRIEEEFRKLMERRGITSPMTFILDGDLTRDSAQERELLEQVAGASAPVVIGTQKVLSCRYTHHFGLVGIVNASALATSSDYRTDERLAYQLAALADFQPERFIVQTFEPENAVFGFLRGDRDSFLENELAARRSFGYPPFSRLALLTYAHPRREQAIHEARLVVEQLRMTASRLGTSESIVISDASPAFMERIGGTYHQTILLKLPPNFERFDVLLRVLPPRWRVDVDPRSTA